MKKTIQLLMTALTVFTLTCLAAFAGEAENKESKSPSESFGRWYGAAFGGINFGHNGDGTATAGAPISATADTELTSGSVGGAGGIKFGYQFQPFAHTGSVAWSSALELEALYSGFNATTEINSAGFVGTSEAHYDTWSVMANWLLKAKMGCFEPYVGIGAGGSYVSRSSTDFNFTVPVAATGTVASDDAFVFALQAIVGADFYLNEQWSLFTEYKYLNLFSPSFSGATTPGPVDTTADYDTIGQHLLVFGVRYGF